MASKTGRDVVIRTCGGCGKEKPFREFPFAHPSRAPWCAPCLEDKKRNFLDALGRMRILLEDAMAEGSIPNAIKVLERQAKMLGYDQPEKHSVGLHDDDVTKLSDAELAARLGFTKQEPVKDFVFEAKPLPDVPGKVIK